MVLGPSGVQFGLWCTSDEQNWMTAKQEDDFLITSMITGGIGWHKVMLQINHNHYNFWRQQIRIGQISP